MTYFDALGLVSILGQDLRFWGTVMIALFLKWLFTASKGTLKESLAGIVAGGVAAYYGVDFVVRQFDGLTVDDRDIVVIALVFTGEHLVRTLAIAGPAIINSKFGPSNGGKKDAD